MIPKLDQLEKIAVDNGFTDGDDIIEMVATIKNTTSNKKMQYKVSHKGTDGMIKLIKSKQEAINTLSLASAILPPLNLVLLGSHADAVNIQNVVDFFKNFNTNAMTESDYDTIKDNYNSLLKIEVIHTDLQTDLQTRKDESKELIDKADEAINFTTTSNDPAVIFTNLTSTMYDFNLPAEQKRVDPLIMKYLTAMAKVDPKNGNTDTDQVVFVTNARTVLATLKPLLSNSNAYITSFVAGDIATYHTELIDASKKLMSDLIDAIIAIFSAPAPVKIKLPPKKATTITQAKKPRPHTYITI